MQHYLAIAERSELGGPSPPWSRLVPRRINDLQPLAIAEVQSEPCRCQIIMSWSSFHGRKEANAGAVADWEATLPRAASCCCSPTYAPRPSCSTPSNEQIWLIGRRRYCLPSPQQRCNLSGRIKRYTSFFLVHGPATRDIDSISWRPQECPQRNYHLITRQILQPPIAGSCHRRRRREERKKKSAAT